MGAREYGTAERCRICRFSFVSDGRSGRSRDRISVLFRLGRSGCFCGVRSRTIRNGFSTENGVVRKGKISRRGGSSTFEAGRKNAVRFSGTDGSLSGQIIRKRARKTVQSAKTEGSQIPPEPEGELLVYITLTSPLLRMKLCQPERGWMTGEDRRRRVQSAVSGGRNVPARARFKEPLRKMEDFVDYPRGQKKSSEFR